MSRSVRFGVVALVSTWVACVDAEEPATPDTTAAFSTPAPLQCNPQEPPPPLYVGGSCTFEIRLDQIENLSGQGASEGSMEVSVEAEADGNADVPWPASPIPLPPGLVMTNEFVPGQSTATGKGNVLATVTVASGQQVVVPMCATITEHDNGGTNGGDDTGTACTNVTLTAAQRPGGKVLCQSSPSAPRADTNLCGDNQCNGSFRAHFEVMVTDADGDHVENEDDFTPDLCDEENKGQLGRASLVYFHMGDGPMTTFYQSMGTDLSKALTGYDYTVLIIDPTYAGPFLVNAAALAGVDLVLEPYEANLYLGMQEITQRGYDMDVWLFSHGNQLHDANGVPYTKFASLDTDECTGVPDGELCGNGVDDDEDLVIDEAACEAIPAGELCWTGDDEDGDGIEDENDGIWQFEITQRLDPALIGTDSVPIRMLYSIACFHQGMNDAWTSVGAKVVSGTLKINFFPVFFGGFADAWNTARTYDAAVVQSDNVLDRGLVYTFMESAGLTFNCDDIGDGVWEEALSVLGLNLCARDFFVDDDGQGSDKAEYDLGADYDAALSGASNMDAQSLRVRLGDGTIKKYVPATLSW